MNNHFIPKLLLRHFPSDKGRISLYDLERNELRPNVKIEDAFSAADFYPDDMERDFNKKTEGAFGNLLNNLILRAKGPFVELSRLQVKCVKKFLLLLVIRSISQDDWIKGEMTFQKELTKIMGNASSLLPPFAEKKIEGEKPREYWLRTLQCILDSQYGIPEEIGKNPNATHMAWRWSWVLHSGYLAFWSSRNTNVDFLVTDIGMTSENEMMDEKGIPNNTKKQISLFNCSELIPDDPVLWEYKNGFLQMACRQLYFHENFMEFPISKDLMIVLINPYYKVYAFNKDKGFPFPSVKTLTKMDDEKAFLPNSTRYAKKGTYSDEDTFLYEIHELNDRDCIYLNLLTLDRVEKTLGFADSSKILNSLLAYQCIPGKLNDYSALIDQISRSTSNV